MVTLSCALLAGVVGSGPVKVNDGLTGPLYKGLPDKNGSIPAPVDPKLSVALFLHGREAGVLLEVRGVGIAFSVIAKSHQ